jgi:hypothetical protein
MEDYTIEQPTNQPAELKDEDITIYPKPRKGCHHCYGRGREGWIKGSPVICRCILNGMGHRKPFMTWKEFKGLLNETQKLEDVTSETVEATNKKDSLEPTEGSYYSGEGNNYDKSEGRPTEIIGGRREETA